MVPHTICLVDRSGGRNKGAEGVNRCTSWGARVMVGRVVGVKVGKGVSVMRGVPVGGVVVGACVFRANKSGVNVAGRLKGVAVGFVGGGGVGEERNGIESSGRAVHPATSERRVAIRTKRFMNHLNKTRVPSAAANRVQDWLSPGANPNRLHA